MNGVKIKNSVARRHQQQSNVIAQLCNDEIDTATGSSSIREYAFCEVFDAWKEECCQFIFIPDLAQTTHYDFWFVPNILALQRVNRVTNAVYFYRNTMGQITYVIGTEKTQYLLDDKNIENELAVLEKAEDDSDIQDDADIQPVDKTDAWIDFLKSSIKTVIRQRGTVYFYPKADNTVSYVIGTENTEYELRKGIGDAMIKQFQKSYHAIKVNNRIFVKTITEDLGENALLRQPFTADKSTLEVLKDAFHAFFSSCKQLFGWDEQAASNSNTIDEGNGDAMLHKPLAMWKRLFGWNKQGEFGPWNYLVVPWILGVTYNIVKLVIVFPLRWADFHCQAVMKRTEPEEDKPFSAVYRTAEIVHTIFHFPFWVADVINASITESSTLKKIKTKIQQEYREQCLPIAFMVVQYRGRDHEKKYVAATHPETGCRTIAEYAFYDVFSAWKETLEETGDVNNPVIKKREPFSFWKRFFGWNKQGEFSSWNYLIVPWVWTIVSNCLKILFMFPLRYLDFKCREAAMHVESDYGKKSPLRHYLLGAHRIFQVLFLYLRMQFDASDSAEKAWDIHPVLGVSSVLTSIGSGFLLLPTLAVGALQILPLACKGVGIMFTKMGWHVSGSAFKAAGNTIQKGIVSACKATEAAMGMGYGVQQKMVVGASNPTSIVGTWGGYINSLRATATAIKRACFSHEEIQVQTQGGSPSLFSSEHSSDSYIMSIMSATSSPPNGFDKVNSGEVTPNNSRSPRILSFGLSSTSNRRSSLNTSTGGKTPINPVSCAGTMYCHSPYSSSLSSRSPCPTPSPRGIQSNMQART